MNYYDPSFALLGRLRARVITLNYSIAANTTLSTTRPSKQSRKEALSRAAYYTKQRNAILNLYPEYFI